MTEEKLIRECEEKLRPKFERLERISLFNTEKVLKAFQKHKLALRHFNPTTGYGYGDEGRDTLNAVVADIFGAEAAVVSPNIASGTHAIALGLYGILPPGRYLRFDHGGAVRHAFGRDPRQRGRLAF